MSLVFEWDNRKPRRNLEKYRVGFVEAVSVFSDPPARIFADEDHQIGEPREIVIGHSSSKRLLSCVSQSQRRNTFALSALGPPPEESDSIIKKTSQVKVRSNRADALRPEYLFDYRKAKANRFASEVSCTAPLRPAFRTNTV
jgi:uncharacterized DUF497 family protein